MFPAKPLEVEAPSHAEVTLATSGRNARTLLSRFRPVPTEKPRPLAFKLRAAGIALQTHSTGCPRRWMPPIDENTCPLMMRLNRGESRIRWWLPTEAAALTPSHSRRKPRTESLDPPQGEEGFVGRQVADRSVPARD